MQVCDDEPHVWLLISVLVIAKQPATEHMRI